jgi:hypothetical protein
MKKQRRFCEYPDCTRKGRNKGLYNGITRYGRFCEFHHKLKQKPHSDIMSLFFAEQKIDNSKCEICGWDKTYCDRHRITPEKGYTKENTKIVCPNCHRLLTLGKLTV